ncbi:MAG: hypothetical protein BWY57_03402 [Betaproteobacteria bacterium ADurb.Bin341]|nr:MAG: hypothetical protein BWY57_03402 [Betaproteobacteria bacterium ADurb.Bin341]
MLVQVVLTVLELRDAHGYRARAFARQLFDRVELGAQLAGLLDLTDELGGFGRLAVQHLLDHALDFGHEIGTDLLIAQFILGLRLENRVFEPDRDRADDAFAHVVAVEFFLAEFVDRFEQALFEG